MAAEPDDATFQQLVLAQAVARATLEQQIQDAATAAVRGFTRWYDTAAITDWAAKLVQSLTPRYRTFARLTDAYLSRTATIVVGQRVPPVGAVNVTQLRAGITAEGSYARAADVFRWQQSRMDAFGRELASGLALLEPPALQDPIDAAVQRIAAVADMDTQLVQRDQSQAFYEAHKDVITGWRRVIHPERSKGGSCGLCVAISDRLYGPTEPLEVHDECKCTTVAVKDHRDPGSKLNTADLKALYAAAGSTGRADLKRTRYQVNEHGELGRVLTDEKDHFRTARQAKRDTSKPRDPRTPAQVRADVQRIHASLEAALPKARQLAGEDAKKWGGYLGKLEDRLADLQSQLAA